MSKKAFKVDNSLVFRPNIEPLDPQNGEMYYDSSSERPRIRVRDSWVDIHPASLLFKVDQVNSFQVKDAVYWDGSLWQLAKADSSTTLATHLVNYKSQTDPDVFELCSIGRIDYGSGSNVEKSVGQYYFLSDRYGADFIIKDTPLSTNITINGIVYNVTGTSVATKLANLTAIVNAISGYRGTGYGDVVAIETPASISISSQDNAIISVSSATTRLGYATPVKPSFGYDNSLFFVESKNALVYNCYRPVALGGISSSSYASSTSIDATTLFAQNFNKSKLSDFVQTGLILTNSSPIHGEISALLVHQSSVTQSLKQSLIVDRAFRNKVVKFSCLLQSTAYDGAVLLTARDETNSVDILINSPLQHTSQAVSALSVLSGSNVISGFAYVEPLNSLSVGCRVTGPEIPPNTFITSVNVAGLTATMSNNATSSNAATSLDFSDLVTVSSKNFTIPANCATLSYTITAAIDSNYTESYIDDISLELSGLNNLDAIVDVPNITSWQVYTPTFQGFGSPTSVDFKWRQVGQNVEIIGNFTPSDATTDEARVSLPGTFISESSPILSNVTVVGSCSQSDFQIAAEPAVNYLFFVDYSNSSVLTRQNADDIVSSGQQLSFFASIPCVGLTATTETSIGIGREIEEQVVISTDDIDFSQGKFLSKVISANTNFTFSNAENGQVRVILITNSTAVDKTIFFPVGKWPGATQISNLFASSSTVITVLVADGNYFYSASTDLR